MELEEMIRKAEYARVFDQCFIGKARFNDF